MRTLERNKTKLWMVDVTGVTESTDIDGFKTGDFVKTYSTPVVIYLSLYPANGKIVEDIFGRDASLDMVAVSNDVVLTKNTLLFLTAPVSNYLTTYDYKVDRINISLNTKQYGLLRRT